MHSYNNTSEMFLQDFFAGSRREVPWRLKKVSNEYLSIAYQEIDSGKAARLQECSTSLVFRRYETGERRLHSMNSCRVRLCPLCTWRRSMRTYANNKRIFDYIAADGKKYGYVLLTLTMKNVRAKELSSSIDSLLYAFKLLAKTVPFKKAVKGWYRGLEVTHNVDPLSKSYDTYHPHLHVVLCVLPSYFTSRNYMSQDAWVQLWKKCLNVDYNPVVDVRKIKNVSDSKAVAEVSKYPVKDSDVLVYDDWDLTVSTVAALDKALANRRLIAYGGILKDAKKELALADEENGDLVNIGDDVAPDSDFVLEFYYWHTGYRQFVKGEIE